MGCVKRYFKPSLLMALCLLVLDQVPYVLCRGRIESFPSCVEIVDIKPPPYSVVKVNKNNVVRFELTFSKPVFVRDGGKERVFLSPNARGRSKKVRAADQIFKSATTLLKRTVKFTIRQPFFNYFGTKYKTFYLVIDGGVFYTHEHITGKFLHEIFVPFSIFGEYYTTHSEKEYRGNRTVQPLSPSPYCRPEPVRRVPDPVGSSAARTKSVSIEIPQKGHQMMVDPKYKYDTPTLNLLALVNMTEGQGTVSLPRTVTAQMNGFDHTVQLPAWNLTFDIPLIEWKIDFKQKLVYELVERVYLSRSQNLVYSATNPTIIEKRLKKNGSVNAQPSYHTAKERRGNKRKLLEVFDGNTRATLLKFERDKHLTWYERTNDGPFFNMSTEKQPKSGIFSARTMKGVSHFLTNNWKLCPPNSTRNGGRSGSLYHSIQYGRLYQMLVMSEPRTWATRRVNGKREYGPPKYLHAITSGGKKIDLSKETQFGWKNKLIPSRIVKALSEDYVCLQVVPTDSPWLKIAVDEGCIFVPKSVADSTGCGGVRLFENISSITSDPNFCNKEMGDCIGEPFSSTRRFPIIPPFGAPELSGWTVEKDTDINNHWPVKVPLTRLLMWLQKGGRIFRLIHGKQFSHLTQLDVHHIPITGFKVMFPHVEFSCDSVWKFEASDMTYSASLTAYIHNTGEGGGHFVAGVNCSADLKVFPSSGTTELWIGPASKAEVIFRLSGSPAYHKPTAKHSCELSVVIQSAKYFSDVVQQFPSCTKTITTYHGVFRDPCKQKEERLPAVDLSYYIIPPDQLEPLTRDRHVQESASTPDERKFLLVKAITISLGVPNFQRDLVANLRQLHVHCGLPNILLTRSYEEFLVHQATGKIPDPQPPRPSLVFTSDDMLLNRVYFFMPIRKADTFEEPVYTDCWAELWANRPHPLCDQPILLSYVAIPLRDHDQLVLEGEKSRLHVVYGNTSDVVRGLLVGCIVMSVILTVCGGSVHGILLLLKKRLPRTSTLKKHKKDLETAMKADAEYWENPQMFMTIGPHGPFYKLHSFQATCPLDSGNIKGLKIAGTLKYENKELQVLFGHVKKVYVDKSEKTIWIQASSGMYELSPEQVDPEYRDEYHSLMKRHGVEADSTDSD